MLEKLHFEEGEFAKWQKYIDIKCLNGEVQYTYGGFKYGNILQTRKGVISNTQKFFECIDRIKLKDWKSEYFAPVLEGHTWKLEYKDSDILKTVHGVNAYPTNYRDLIRLINSIKMEP